MHTVRIDGTEPVELPLTDEILIAAREWTRLEYDIAVEALEDALGIAGGVVQFDLVAIEAANVARFAENAMRLKRMVAHAGLRSGRRARQSRATDDIREFDTIPELAEAIYVRDAPGAPARPPH